MRNPLDAIRFVLPRVHQTQVARAEVFHGAHDVRDVHQVLRLVENHDDHPTSSKMPNRAGSSRSPRRHNQAPPPPHTSRPPRRLRPRSISFTMRSKGPPAPALGVTPPGPGMATPTHS